MLKNYNFALFLLLSGCLLVMTACEKNDDVQAKTRTELLTADSWRLTAFTVDPGLDIDGDEVPETELLSLLPACSRDDITVFRNNNTYTEEEGLTKCDDADPQVFTTGTWAFSADENRITFNPTDGDPYTVKMEELTASNLRTTTTFTDSANTTYTFTSVYSH